MTGRGSRLHGMGWAPGLVGLGLLCALAHAPAEAEDKVIPDRTVVLTFDDGVRSHLEFVAPLLKELEFNATFFISRRWLTDTEHFLSWAEVAQLHEMGFEIGNHSWNHDDYGQPANAAGLAGELTLVDNALAEAGVPKPVSFAWSGNGFGPEGLAVLRGHGILFARRGKQPEIPYGLTEPGAAYDLERHDPLLMPSTFDAYPETTLDDLRAAVSRAADGKVAVLQFHGVPDEAHPWVSTERERFREYMLYLKRQGCRVLAMRDLAEFVDPLAPPQDAMARVRFTPGATHVELPQEVIANRADPVQWLAYMMNAHGYTLEEAAASFAYPPDVLQAKMAQIGFAPTTAADLEGKRAPTPPTPTAETLARVLPYPGGGRHPRIGFLDGAVDPRRGTKISVFPWWDETSYVVLDVPEAIYCEEGMLFLAHTHMPTMWDLAHTRIENADWKWDASREAWKYALRLPNGVWFGAEAKATPGGAAFELWLENGSDTPLRGLRTQVCAMLKGLEGCNAQDGDIVVRRDGVAAVRHEDGRHWVLTAFDQWYRTWNNPPVPCMHSDPKLPDAEPGERVSVTGVIRFYEGDDIDGEIARLAETIEPAEGAQP